MLVCHHNLKNKKRCYTPAEENYIRCIYNLEKNSKEKIKIKDLAKSLCLKKSSVLEMVRKLEKKGILNYNKKGISLTKKGKNLALKIIYRYKLAEKLLTEVLGCDPKTADEKACELEHIFDKNIIKKISSVLKNGKKIELEKKREKNDENKYIKLTDCEKNEKYIVIKIPKKRVLLKQLTPLNILPYSKIEVVEKCRKGNMIIKLNNCCYCISCLIASKIFVKRI